jgi:hypothetical protein
MAAPTGTMQSYQAVGNREDLSGIIDDISPTDTPFYSRVKKTSTGSTSPEWQTDALDAPAANLMIEGDDATTNTATPTVRLKNYIQTSQKVPRVSGLQRELDSAGRGDELDYQKMKRGKELKNDVEYALVRNQASSAGSATVPRASAGLESWIATNKTSVGTGTAQTTPGFSGGTVAAPTDSTVTGSVAEAHLKTIAKTIYDAGGAADLIMVGTGAKQKFSGFAGIATQYRENTGNKRATILGAADIYISDYGEYKIVANRKVRDVTALFLDMEHWEVKRVRGITSYPLAKTGDSDRALMVTDYTLASLNEKASGKITDINSAL